MADLLSNLNPPQLEAVTHPRGPLLIVAGAGSGKTRVITHRIAWLIREGLVPPWGVFAATFTNKAAGEMRERVERLLGRPDLHLNIATFHSLCARILRREAALVGRSERFTILDEADQLSLIKESMKTLGYRTEDCPPGHAQWMINQAKMRLEDPDEFAKNLPSLNDDWVVDVYRHYQRRVEESDAFDFEDLLLTLVRLFERVPERRQHYQRRFEHVLVDEYQDTNQVQYRLVRLLSAEHHNLCVVGDEDQSIYSWRGANLDNILSFQRDHPGAKVVKLEQNYRSTGNILHAASAVIALNTERLGKTLWTAAGEGDPLTVMAAPTEHMEAHQVVSAIERLRRDGIPLRQMAVFYRINALSRVFEEKLIEADIPYRIYGGVRFFERREVKDMLAYLQLIANPNNAAALLRVINVPRRGVGDTTVRRVAEVARDRGVGLWPALKTMIEFKEIKGKAAAGLAKFIDQVEAWREDRDRLGLSTLLERVIAETGYLDYLKKSEPIGFDSREENVAELGRSMDEYQAMAPEAGLLGYLEKIALETATDDYDADQDSVSLMSLHVAKGLEFDVVFMVGMEEPIFPNRRAVEEGRGLEEERRLFYVGLTRARRLVHLCYSQSRFLHGQAQWNIPSMFLAEIPAEVLTGDQPKRRLGLFQKSVAPAPQTPQVFSRQEYRTGQRVTHDVFGVGTVLGTKGEGPMRKVSVRFESEIVDFLERYAKLTTAEEAV